MGKMLFKFVLLALCLCMGSSEPHHKRPTRSIDVLKNPIFSLFKKAEPEPVVEIAVPQPIYKVHKYNGIQVKPIATAVPVITNVPDFEIKKKLPSLDDIKLLLGTTSHAETLDAMRELVSSREGLELVAGYIKQFVGELPVDITKMSQEDVGSFITKYYQYSTPVAYAPPKPFVRYGPPVKYGAPQKLFASYEVPKQYGAPYEGHGAKAEAVAPVPKYGVPTKTYGVPKEGSAAKSELIAPAKTYGTPFRASAKADFVAPVSTYGVPQEAKAAKSDAIAPVQKYGLPYQASDAKADFVAPVETYGVPKEEKAAKSDVVVPAQTYGLPYQGNDAKADFVAPVETYGVPKEAKAAKSDAIVPVQTYGLPYQGNDVKADFVAPVETYGVPKEGNAAKSDVVVPVQTYGLPYQGNDAKADFVAPVEAYGVPKEANAAKSDVVAPVETYGLPYQGNNAKADFTAPVDTYGAPKQRGGFQAEVIEPIHFFPPKMSQSQFTSFENSPQPDISVRTPDVVNGVQAEVIEPIHFLPPKTSQVQFVDFKDSPQPDTSVQTPGEGVTNDKLLPIVVSDAEDRDQSVQQFTMSAPSKFPDETVIVDFSPKQPEAAASGQDSIVPFPMISELPAVEDMFKFRTEEVDEKDFNSVVIDLPFQRRTPVFSFSAMPGTATEIKDDQPESRPNVIETKFEQPGFSYTQLSSLPLEDGAFDYSPDRVTSFGEKLPSYIFDQDALPAASEVKPVVTKPLAKLEVKNVKVNNSEVKNVTEKHEAVTKKTETTTVKADKDNKNQRRRWMPKSRRKYVVASA